MVVLDASVILKWAIPETGSVAAVRFRDRHVAGEEQIVVPPLLFYEVGNALRYHEEISETAIVEFFDILDELELLVVEQSAAELASAVLDAREMRMSVYDSSYVTLARQCGCRLITADRKLADAVSESFVEMLNPS